MQHLHSRGFYHGNLNPDNIFVQKGTLKIGDLRSTKQMQTPPGKYMFVYDTLVHKVFIVMVK